MMTVKKNDTSDLQVLKAFTVALIIALAVLSFLVWISPPDWALFHYLGASLAGIVTASRIFFPQFGWLRPIGVSIAFTMVNYLAGL